MLESVPDPLARVSPRRLFLCGVKNEYTERGVTFDLSWYDHLSDKDNRETRTKLMRLVQHALNWWAKIYKMPLPPVFITDKALYPGEFDYVKQILYVDPTIGEYYSEEGIKKIKARIGRTSDEMAATIFHELWHYRDESEGLNLTHDQVEEKANADLSIYRKKCEAFLVKVEYGDTRPKR